MTVIKLLRLVKLWPLYKLLKTAKKFNVNLVRLIEVLITYYMICHVFGCIWLSMALA